MQGTQATRTIFLDSHQYRWYTLLWIHGCIPLELVITFIREETSRSGRIVTNFFVSRTEHFNNLPLGEQLDWWKCNTCSAHSLKRNIETVEPGKLSGSKGRNRLVLGLKHSATQMLLRESPNAWLHLHWISTLKSKYWSPCYAVY